MILDHSDNAEGTTIDNPLPNYCAMFIVYIEEDDKTTAQWLWSALQEKSITKKKYFSMYLR